MKSARTFAALLLFAFLLVAIGGSSQEHPTVTAQSNTVYVTAEGKYEAPPDTAQIQFNVSVQDDTPQAAFERASKNVEQVREVLRANGVEPKNATFGYLSVQPVYDYRNPKQHVVGYRVSSDVMLKLKDFSKVGPITQQLAEANVSESQSVNYTLENMDEAKNKAVEDAYRRARRSAETVARASGRTLGDLSYAAVDTWDVQHIAPRMARAANAMAAAAVPAPNEEFTPQSVNVGARLNALFNLK
jgi:uncharacterized protein